MASFDAEFFWKRIGTLYKEWGSGNNRFLEPFQALLILTGKQREEIIYSRTLAMQLWLCGYELFETLMMFTKNKITVVASSKKIKLFEALGKREGFPELELISKIKGDDSYIKDIVAALVSGSAEVAKVGLLVKDLQEGAFAESIMDALNKNSLLSIEDISSGISDLLASKDAFGIEQSRKAATASSVILKDFLQNRIEDIIADDKSVTHSQLSEEVDKIFGSPDELVKLFSKHPEISYDELDTCYSPIIQSGGKYDLKPSASSNDDALHSGVIIAEVGIRYASYCSNIIRTMFINADESQQRTYKLLLKVYMACVSTLKDGARVSDVYKSAIKVIRAREPSLEEKFTKNCGFLTGLDFRDSSYVLNGTNNRKIRVGMVFNLIIGFEDLEKPRVRDPRGKNYAILVGDTVLVTSKGCEHLTSGELNFKEVSYQMDEEGDEDAGFLETGAGIPLSFAGDEIGPRTRASRNKKNNDEEYLLQQNRIKEEQKAIAKRKHEEALKKYVEKRVGSHFSEIRPQESVMNSYPDVSKFPQDANPSQIVVDVSNESILVPIYGQTVPFHVDTIKSINKSEQAEFTILRINFLTPEGQANISKIPSYADLNSIYIRELSFKSSDSRNLNRVLRLVKELQKRMKQREQEYKEQATIVEQEELRLNKDKKEVPRLRDVQIRPKVGGKKNNGTFEAHLNGFRFVTHSNIIVDITYSNIKQAFFHPCKNTVSVIFHFELKNPIKINKKRTNYVQVYLDVIDASQDLSQRQQMYDRDGLQEEQEERRRRRKANERFRQFAKIVTELVDKNDPDNTFEFDFPEDRLMFTGVPNKTGVNIYPTGSSFISLEDNPPFVLALDEVELAYFERVQLSLKNFDLVFVYKDLDRPVVKIRSIPTQSLDSIQSYLTEMGVMYYVGPMNLQWPRILKVVKDDPKSFYEDGGWEVVLGENDEDEEGVESESEYEESEDEASMEEDTDEYESDAGSDEEDGDEEFDEEDDEEEGLDWDELEERAIQEDKKRRRSDDEDERPRSSKNRRR